MLNAILVCMGILLASAEHAPDAPAWAWAFNFAGVGLMLILAWRCRKEENET
tara:strand:- start:414 stop:569 length:156 start_codon:yes stop_codon:yes gene_type:complete